MSLFSNITIRLSLFFTSVLMAMSGCNVAKHLPEGAVLVTKNKVELTGTNAQTDASTVRYRMETVVKQKPNQRILFIFPFRLWLNQTFRNACSTCGIRKWIRDKAGEPPVLYDASLTQKSIRDMKKVMASYGYYNPEVRIDSIVKKRRISVSYHVSAGPELIVDSLAFDTSDSLLLPKLRALMPISLLKKGNPLSSQTLIEERSRVVMSLKEQGYFAFGPNFINFEADTFHGLGTKVQVYLNVQPPNDSSHHRIYRLDSIFLHPNYNPSDYAQGFDTIGFNGYFFINKKGERPFVRPKALLSQLSLYPKDLYSPEKFKQTNNTLRDLSAYRNASVRYRPNSDSTLRTEVYLIPAKRMAFGFELEGNTIGSFPGVAGNVNYRHNNLFRGGETFVFTGETGVQVNLSAASGSNNQNNLINTLDINIDASIYFPRYIGLRFMQRRLRMENAKTRVYLRYNRLVRFDAFEYNSYNAGFGYDWSTSDRDRHSFAPVNISLLQPNVLGSFADVVNSSQILKNTFRPYIIFSFFNYTWNHTGPVDKKGGSLNWKLHAETAGSMINLVDRLFVSDTLRFFKAKTDYSQYVQADLDLRYNKPIGAKSSFAARFFGGVGVPFSNSSVLPYTKQYFGGGTNGIRAWRARTLGPGSYNNPSEEGNTNLVIDRVGDIRLEMNAEYRFPIYTYFNMEGALFVDAGNIWTLYDDPQRPNSQFQANRFFNEIAMGVGFGLRFNFSFFILRIDAATQIRAPYQKWRNRTSYWVEGNWWDNTNLNIAVGYPF